MGFRRLKNYLREGINYDHPYYDYMEHYDVRDVFEMYRQKEKPWTNLINPESYHKALKEFVEYGEFIRFPKEKVFQWFGVVMKNTAILRSLCVISGRFEWVPIYDFLDVFFYDSDIDDVDADKWNEYKESIDESEDYSAMQEYLDTLEPPFYDWCRMPDGSPAYTDYGLTPLEDIISEYSDNKTAEETLVLLNRALDVAHMNGDLSSIFIVGGRKTLTMISEDIKKNFCISTNVLNESTNTKKFKDRTIQVIREFFHDASWLDREYVSADANPEHLSTVDYIEKVFRDEFFHGNVHQTVMRLEPIFMNVALKLGFQQNEPDVEKLSRLLNIAHYISSEVNKSRESGVKPSFNLSAMTTENTTYESLEEEFGKTIDELQDQENEKLDSREWNKDINPEYEILYDIDYATAHKYGNHTCPSSKLCYTQNESTWNQYTQNGRNKVYLILNKNWENILPVHGEDTPYDEYGKSMIFLFVNLHGVLVYSNTRWNHEVGGNTTTQIDHAFTKEDISNILKVNFNDLFVINDKTFKKMAAKAVDDYKAGNKDAFDGMGEFYDGCALVRLRGFCNFINENDDLLSDKWFDIADRFKSGIAVVCINDKYNFIDTSGRILYEPEEPGKWFKEAYNENGVLIFKTDLNKFNILGHDGRVVYNHGKPDNWFDYLEISTNKWLKCKCYGKCNYINGKGEILYKPHEIQEWFSANWPFENGFAIVTKNNLLNFINEDGEILYEPDNINNWFTEIDQFIDGYARVANKEKKYNFINENGELMLYDWANKCMEFKNGYAAITERDECYIVDSDFQQVIHVDDVRDYDFHEGFAVIELCSNCNYINEDGDVLFPDRWFYECSEFSNGIGVVGIMSLRGHDIIDYLYNFVNTEGKIMSDKWFIEWPNFEHGYAFVVPMEETYMRLIQSDGKYARRFNPDVMKVVKEDSEYMVVSYSGEYSGDEDNRYITKYNIAKKNGSIISGIWFDGCELFYNGFAIVRVGKLYNYIKPTGELLYKEYQRRWFQSATEFNDNGYAKVSESGRYNILRSDGRLVYNHPYWDWFAYIESDANEDLFIVFNEDDMWNIMDNEGNIWMEKWLPSTIDVFPLTFEHDGKQYVMNDDGQVSET